MEEFGLHRSVGEVDHGAVGQDLEVALAQKGERIARSTLGPALLLDVLTALPPRLDDLAVRDLHLGSVYGWQLSHSSCVVVAGSPAHCGLGID